MIFFIELLLNAQDYAFQFGLTFCRVLYSLRIEIKKNLQKTTKNLQNLQAYKIKMR